MRFTEADVARFMRYVDKLPSGCWFWTGARSRGRGNRKWYGSFRLGRTTVRAHRFACEALGGQPCPAGHHRDHVCSFSMCVNPDHLEVVSREVNQARKMKRIRSLAEANEATLGVPVEGGERELAGVASGNQLLDVLLASIDAVIERKESVSTRTRTLRVHLGENAKLSREIEGREHRTLARLTGIRVPDEHVVLANKLGLTVHRDELLLHPLEASDSRLLVRELLDVRVTLATQEGLSGVVGSDELGRGQLVEHGGLLYLAVVAPSAFLKSLIAQHSEDVKRNDERS